MKPIKSAVVVIILSFGLTGCYTQLEYTRQMSSGTQTSAANGYSWSGDDDRTGRVAPEEGEKTGSGYYRTDKESSRVNNEYEYTGNSAVFGSENALPVYYKDYEVLEVYDACGCDPYRSYTLSFSPYYSGFGFSTRYTTYGSPAIWAPDWFLAFHAGYDYRPFSYSSIALWHYYNNFHYRHWAFHHYHMGHTLADAWFYYDSFYYDPFYSGFYGRGLFSNYYYFGSGYGSFTGGNVHAGDDNRRYGPRSDIGSSTIADRDKRSRSSTGVTGTGDGAQILRKRSEDNAKRRSSVTVRKNRNDDSVTRSRLRNRSGVIIRTGDEAERRRNRVRSSVTDTRNSSSAEHIRVRQRTGAFTPVNKRLPAERSRIESRIRDQRAVQPQYNPERTSNTRSLFGRFDLGNMKSAFKSHSRLRQNQSSKIHSFPGSSRTGVKRIGIGRSRSDNGNSVKRTRSRSSSSDNSSKRSRSRDGDN